MALSSSDVTRPVLAALNTEITDLVARVTQSTGTVIGHTKAFGETSGSGWLYSSEYLVTNSHVIEDLIEPVFVELSNRRLKAEVVGHDPMTDLAVLRIVESNRDPALDLRVGLPALGELCFAFGNPLGEFPESVSIGVVSGLMRTLPLPEGHAIHDVIQTDCAINLGNSGGPLVGVDGRVIGVNTAKRGEADNIGFAVPADTVTDIVPELIKHGSIAHASLDVGVAERIVAIDDGESGHLVVTRVRASSAGPFQVGDVLLIVNDQEVRRPQDLRRVLRRNLVNQKVPVCIWRNGQRMWINCVPVSLRGSD